jgi:hypothetical protein
VTKPRDLANSVNTGPVAGFRNLIINGNPTINQRGYVSATATGGANEYTLDRWRVVTSGQDLTFSTTAGVCTATAPAGGVEQVVEGASILGGTYVLNWTGTATATVDGGAVTKGGTVTLTGGTNATVRLIDGTFTKVQLEPGSVATPFEERPVGAELQLCQRYYEEVWCQWATSWSASMNNHSAKYKVTKRAEPTLTVYADTTAYAKTGTVANVRNTTGSADIAVGLLMTEGSVDGFAIDYVTGTASAINMRATVVASIEL